MVYVVEDDHTILGLVLYALKSQNIESEGFMNAEDCLKAIEVKIPQLILLDIMLPKIDGFEMLKKLKSHSKTRHISVILLSALNSEFEIIKGLDLGADDYLTKPFGIMELLARIRVILRRNEHNNDEIIFDGLIFSTQKHCVTLYNQPIELTLKEFELLSLLLKNKEKSFSRDEILELIWGYSYTGESRTVDMHIKTLRQKLGEWGKKIKTIRGIGYKLERE
ncbi:DNA-binding response regulator [Helicobacter monodelphidis]|uniref:response regulator transcription factor n=1 Tax=Helicobacter sp. 15-1451 TaxID=2004995 RepID=UPI000DCDE220|nr:response regulator transcription factor [Helicobacter sp. 15-1451]RAX56525.1 DNA-binding response regulator [Helicobacter sp. 15-1451]